MAKEREHSYHVQVEWEGNLGEGTAAYKAYSRAHVISSAGKPGIPGSSEIAFRGDPYRYNPEELLVGSISACHMLWYLHLCAVAGVVVVKYEDYPEGVMVEGTGGSGKFKEVTLKPVIEITARSDAEKAKSLHESAHEKCFIANSVNFPVSCEPCIRIKNDGAD